MLCPTAPSLPWVAWASLPHLPRYSAPLRLPPCPSRVASLVARFPIPCLLPLCSWCSLGARGGGGTPPPPPGLWSPGPPLPGVVQGTLGSSPVPRPPPRITPP